MKTWKFEVLFVSTFLLVTLVLKAQSINRFEISEIVCDLAVLVTFMHGQVADRMAEKQAAMVKPDVDCYRFSQIYYVTKELLWIFYFYLLNSYAALVGAVLFLIYPLWRKYYRSFNSEE
jgi:hypothetical protein